ncbi:MAG: calcium-binding protein [Acidimicrobiales bacterium]
MRDGTQQGAVTPDVDRQPAWGRRRSTRRPITPTSPSGPLSAGGLVVGVAVALAGLMGATGSVVDRTIDDNTTVFSDATTVAAPFVPSDPSADFGRMLLPVDAGIIAVGSEGVNGATATVVLIGAEGPPASADVVFAEQTIAASGSTLVVVDDGRLRVASIGTDGLLTEIASHERTDGAAFADVAALGGATLAVLRDSAGDEAGFVDVFDLNGGVQPVVALAPELERVSIAVDTSGDLVAVSGVRSQAATGEVQFFRRSGDAWLVDARFDGIGGGAVVASSTVPGEFLVQRNGFFTRPSGVWTRIGPDAGGRLQTDPEWSVQASSAASDGTLVAFGLPGDERTMTFSIELADEAAGGGSTAVVDLRHAQTIQAPIPVPADGSPARRRPPPSQFGTAVAFVQGRLVVAGPGLEIDGVRDEGAIFVFEATVGPAGCTITGTDGDDTLNGTTDDDVICGLGGNDLIRGNLGFDRIYGGPGDDDLSGDAADDLLVGGAGNDRLAGGAGADALYGGDGNDRLYGGAGNDHLDGGDGRDPCYGGADIDTFNAC